MYYSGIDLHRDNCYITTVDDQGAIVKQQRVPNSPVLVLDYFTTLGCEHRTVVESTTGWYWLNDLLESAHIPMVLAHAKYLKAISYAKVKTDKVDSQTLATLLRLNLIPAAHKISTELRGLRDTMRIRLRLVQQRTACYRRSESILAKFNLPDNIPASYQVQSAAIDQVVQSLTTQILALEKSLHHRSSKDGNKYLKIAFCDAAVHAIQYYPEVKAFYNKMVRRGNTAIARTIAAKELAKNRLSHTQEQRTLSGFQRSADLTAEVFAVAATAKPGCLTDIS